MHYIACPCRRKCLNWTTCRSPSSFYFAFLAMAAPSVNTHVHTVSHTHSGIPGLYSPATSSDQSRQLLQCALWCPFFLPSLSLSAGQLGLQQPIDLRRSLAALLTWIHLTERLLSFRPPKSIQALFIVYISPWVRQVWHCCFHLG